MIPKLKFNILEFAFKNLFWYAALSAINQEFNPTKWWIAQHFWGGVLFVIFEFFIFSSCLTEINKEEDGN
jgi:hypothetical protein